MTRIAILLGGLALGAVLYLAGSFFGGRLDTEAYPDFAAAYGVDCSGTDWRGCERLLDPARTKADALGENFDPPAMSRRLALLGGAFGLAVALAIYGRTG